MSLVVELEPTSNKPALNKMVDVQETVDMRTNIRMEEEKPEIRSGQDAQGPVVLLEPQGEDGKVDREYEDLFKTDFNEQFSDDMNEENLEGKREENKKGKTEGNRIVEKEEHSKGKPCKQLGRLME